MEKKIEFNPETGPVKLFSCFELLDDPSFDRSDFGYIFEGGNEFALRLFKHQDCWHDLDQFQLISKPGRALGMWDLIDWDKQFEDWLGISHDSAFSAVVVKHPLVDGEPVPDYVIAATCHW